MIRDDRGKVPNIVIVDGAMRHQWTGKEVPLKDKGDRAELRRAHARLKKEVGL